MKNLIVREDMEKCRDFCRAIIGKEDQYNRMNEHNDLRMFRTDVGKIGELDIQKLGYFLNTGNIEGFKYSDDMFKIFEGQTNADKADFFIDDKSVDVKTIYASDHRNIVIPVDQPIKDIYICSKIITKNTWYSKDFNQYKDANWGKNIGLMIRDITDYNCEGFILKSDVLKQPIKNFGNEAYFVSTNILNKNIEEIEKLLKNISPVESISPIQNIKEKNTNIIRPQ